MNDLKSIAVAIKNGDEKAFEAFFRMEFNNIVHFIDAYLGNNGISEDIAQESFISFWNKRNLINEKLNIRSYIFTIARNKTINYIRDYKLTETDSINHKQYELNLYALSHEIVIQKIDAVNLEELINKTYSKLPDDIRKFFQLNRIYGLTYAQIAKRHNVPIKFIEYRIKKALNEFKKNLKNYISLFCFL